jgi:hypothetical protein
MTGPPPEAIGGSTTVIATKNNFLREFTRIVSFECLHPPVGGVAKNLNRPQVVAVPFSDQPFRIAAILQFFFSDRLDDLLQLPAIDDDQPNRKLAGPIARYPESCGFLLKTSDRFRSRGGPEESSFACFLRPDTMNPFQQIGRREARRSPVISLIFE